MRAICRGFLFLTLLTLVSSLLAQQSSTTVPNLVRYGGVVKDAQGAAMASRTVGITFLIYGQQDGGAPVWLETQNVATDAAGQYSVLLGSTTATGLPSDLFAQQEQRWLGVQVQGEAEQARVLLVSVPYAFKASEADKLAGHSASEFVTTDNLQSAVQQQLQQHAETGSSSPATDGSGKNPPAGSGSATTSPPTNFSGSTSNQIVGVTQNGSGAGVKSSAPSEAVMGTATAASGKAIAVHGMATGTGGVGLKGFATASTGSTIGVSAYVASPAGTVAVLNNGAGGKIISGQNNGVEKFSVDGGGNVNSTAGTYRIGGFSAVSIGAAADQNLFLGVGAGASNVAGSGVYNAFSGYQAGYSNTTGSYNSFSGHAAGYSNTAGSSNAFTGLAAGYFNTTGNYNTFSGPLSGFSNTSGHENTFSGFEAGFFNTSGYDNAFSGSYAGYSNTTGKENTFSGFKAGYSNTEGFEDTFSGYQAGFSNTTGSDNTFSGSGAGGSNTTGNYNTFSGSFAGSNNTTGEGNTFSGHQAGSSNTTGDSNTVTGYQAGLNNTTGFDNTFTGSFAGFYNTTGDSDTFTGYQAGAFNTTGYWNTFSGYQAGYNNTSGRSNTFIGSFAGSNNTIGTENVYIANVGFAGYENGTIRIGDPSQQGSAYIAGIWGSISSGGTYVFVNGSGQLGTATSSRRFKEQIRDMGESTNALMKLRPVTFLYKPEYDKGLRTLQYGLIAEEVAEIYPDLVAYEPDGKPYTVKYQYLTTMLLNEMQKEFRRVDEQADVIKAQQQDVKAQAEVIKTQQQEIDGLKAQLRLQNAAFQERLSRLESMVGTQTQIAADRSHQ